MFCTVKDMTLKGLSVGNTVYRWYEIYNTKDEITILEFSDLAKLNNLTSNTLSNVDGGVTIYAGYKEYLALPGEKGLTSYELPEESLELYQCDICGNSPNEDNILTHGKGCYTQSADGGGDEYIENKYV